MAEMQADEMGVEVQHLGMAQEPGTVAWISIAPVKGLGLLPLDRATLTRDGIRGDREYAIIDEHDRLINGKRHGELAAVRPIFDASAETLQMSFPDGSVAIGTIEVGSGVEANVFGEPTPARIVNGPWSRALTVYLNRPVRLIRLARPGPDRGPTVTLLSVAALTSLARAGGRSGPLDQRRFRMTFGVEGIPANAEDNWVGGRVGIGGAIVEVVGHVGRCVVTSHDPDTGKPTFETLKVLKASRGSLDTTERLPFGVWGRVVTDGEVSIGGLVIPLPA